MVTSEWRRSYKQACTCPFYSVLEFFTYFKGWIFLWLFETADLEVLLCLDIDNQHIWITMQNVSSATILSFLLCCQLSGCCSRLKYSPYKLFNLEKSLKNASFSFFIFHLLVIHRVKMWTVWVLTFTVNFASVMLYVVCWDWNRKEEWLIQKFIYKPQVCESSTDVDSDPERPSLLDLLSLSESEGDLQTDCSFASSVSKVSGRSSELNYLKTNFSVVLKYK